MKHDAPPSSLPPRPDHGGPAARLGARRDVVRARLDGGAFRPSHPVSVGGGDFRSCASTLVRHPLASLGSDPRGRRLPRSRGRTTVPRSMEARWLETLRGARIARRRAAGFQGNRVHVRDPRRQPLRRGLRRAQADLPGDIICRTYAFAEDLARAVQSRAPRAGLDLKHRRMCHLRTHSSVGESRGRRPRADGRPFRPRPGPA